MLIPFSPSFLPPPTFFGLRDHARQAMIWDALDAEYGRESVRRVGSLLAFSPAEWDLEDVLASEHIGTVATT